MTKKPTITRKVCGGEHSGTICTKFTTVRVLEHRRPKPAALLTGPKKRKPKA